MYYDQNSFAVRCEWGAHGVELVGREVDVIIIVDALSFSTCVDIAVTRGAYVFPYAWKDATADDYARQLGATLAGPRSAGRYSLSPQSMFDATDQTRIVLPSPNGAAMTLVAEKFGKVVLTGCFRNRRAIAEYANGTGGTIAVIPVGERWPDGSLRPAIEDLAAAGAIIEELRGTYSPEARAAVAVWKYSESQLTRFVMSSTSGRELSEKGFEEDVQLTYEVDVSQTVPILWDGVYVRASR